MLAACGSTADTGAGATGAGGIKTDKGVTDTTISLGIMGDTSGVFKNLDPLVQLLLYCFADRSKRKAPAWMRSLKCP